MENAQKVGRGRRLLTGGALVTGAGLAISGSASAPVLKAGGSWIVLLGWTLLVYGLHVFGRAGSE